MKILVCRIFMVVLALFSVCFYSKLLSANEVLPGISDLSKDIPSFIVKYSVSFKSGFLQQGNFIFKENIGFVENTPSFNDHMEDSMKMIENFSEKIGLDYHYEEKAVDKINYKSIYNMNDFEPQFTFFSLLDIFQPFRYNVLKNHSIKMEGVEKIKDKECNIISAVITKYPFLYNNCKIWQAKDNKFVYKFIIYDEEDKPIFSLEVAEVKINPVVEDKEFSVEIPQGLKEIDITEQFRQQYRLLIKLYEALCLNNELRNSNYELKNTIKNLNNAAKILEKREPEQKFVDSGNKTEKDIRGSSVFSPVTKSPSILYIAPGMGFAIIGLGRIDGLEIGDIFQVYHNNELLGKIEISKIYDDMAVAEFVDKESLQRAEVGDKVIKLGSGEF